MQGDGHGGRWRVHAGQSRHGGVDSFVTFALKLLSGAHLAHVLAHVRTGPSLLVEIAGTRLPTLPASVTPHIAAHPLFRVEGHGAAPRARCRFWCPVNVGRKTRVTHHRAYDRS